MAAKILIVDDEPYMLRIIELSLGRRGGYQLVTACNGRDAIALAQHERPQVIVMDVLMPVMDGLAALRKLRGTPETSAIPVIMLTARGQILTRQEAEASGASLFLTKPFSPTQLLKEVDQLIANRPPTLPPVSAGS